MEDGNMKNLFKDKRVLVFGLGLLGGGVATTNWLLQQGAKVTITDLKTKKQLASSLKKIRGKVTLRLGGHSKADILKNDILVVNPDVSFRNEFIAFARKKGKKIENEATIFYKLWPGPIVAITGTRGKTTTTNWANHFIGAKYKSIAAGNSYKEPFLEALKSSKLFGAAVVEMPSYHLEFFNIPLKAPRIAVITNISQDHLNRYVSLKDYANAKANIFKNQKKSNILILNKDNEWTKFFLGKKPQSQVYFFSQKPLPKNKNGVWAKGDTVYFQENAKRQKVLSIKGFERAWGFHNTANLLAASLGAYLFGVGWPKIQGKIKSLPTIEFRQQPVFKNKKLLVINDTTATSPDGAIVAMKRFGAPSTVLITGGTDRKLDFSYWGKEIKKYLKPENIIFLDGSATKKMKKAIGSWGIKIPVFGNLKDCVRHAKHLAGKYKQSVILFSPASKSFEKFQNEYDRGEQFNTLVRKEMGS